MIVSLQRCRLSNMTNKVTLFYTNIYTNISKVLVSFPSMVTDAMSRYGSTRFQLLPAWLMSCGEVLQVADKVDNYMQTLAISTSAAAVGWVTPKQSLLHHAHCLPGEVCAALCSYCTHTTYIFPQNTR